MSLIESIDDLEGAIRVGKEFQKATGHPIRYIDIVFVKYGQMGESSVLGTKDGICLENNPKCDLCEVTEICNYVKK